MALLKKDNARQVLDISRAQLEKLVLTDFTFPRPIKLGTKQQSSVFFVQEELDTWIEEQKAKRGKGAV